MLTRHVVALLTAGALGASLVACTTDIHSDWHPVTTEESQVLAMTRFQNFDAGSRPFETDLTVQGQQLHFAGWYDFATHTGYAKVQSESSPDQAILWSSEAVALRQQKADASGMPALPVPDPALDGWNTRSLSPAESSLDAFLSAFTLLGSDRPDNPLLLQQAGALWLGTDEADGADLQVFAGPPSDEPLGEDSDKPTPETATVKYAIDPEGLMRKVDLQLGAQWVSVSFTHQAEPSAELPASLLSQLKSASPQ